MSDYPMVYKTLPNWHPNFHCPICGKWCRTERVSAEHQAGHKND